MLTPYFPIILLSLLVIIQCNLAKANMFYLMAEPVKPGQVIMNGEETT